MSLELNKIAAAVLTGGVLAMSSGFIANLLIKEQHLEESVYEIAGVESAGPVAAEAGPSLEPVLPLLASASVADGEALAKKCVACHLKHKDKKAPDMSYASLARPDLLFTLHGTHFQFRSLGDEPLAVVGVTMPPWPGEDEAVVVPGAWPPTVPS